ncbi:MAG: CaiB/BaiF CoA transferase family protein [Pseudomonadales bacterium]
MAAAPALLDGVRVLSIEQYAAGPYGTQLLVDLGAEVVKVENAETGGDVSRALTPHLLGASDSQFFQTFSRGKKSICLNLKDPQDRQRFEALLPRFDAVANNLRGDLPASLGLRYEDLSAANPQIVCAHLSAYGRDNSRAAWPGYDYLMQAEGGFLALTGEPDGPPARFGLSMVDFMTGSLMALSLVAAVLSARRTHIGCDVDTSLFDTALHQLSYPATWYLNEAQVTERLPRSSHPSIVPSQLFRTADGWMFVMCQTPKFWQRFCESLQRPQWAADPRFLTPPDRLQHRAALETEIETVLRTASTEHWCAELAGVVPVAPVYDVGQALDNTFVQEVGMTHRIAHPERPDGLRVLSSPFKINGQRPVSSRAPLLGEHDDET